MAQAENPAVETDATTSADAQTVPGQDGPADRVLVGIAAIQGAVFLFTVQDVILKLLGADYSIWQLQFLRSAIGIAPLAVFAWWVGGWKVLKTRRPGLHAIRGFIGFLAYSTYFAALPLMPMAEVAALFYASPLFITLLSALVLREPLGIHRIGAVAVGFAGVLVMIRPGTEVFDPVSLLPLSAALCYAVSMIITRAVRHAESSTCVAFYLNAGYIFWSLLFSLLAWWVFVPGEESGPLWNMVRPWTMPDSGDMGLVVVMALIGVTGHVMLTHAYRSAPASAIAPFDYTYLLWSALFGFLVWGDAPTMEKAAGMALVVSGGLYIAWRETVWARRGRRPKTAYAVILPTSAPRSRPHPSEQPPA